MQAYRPLEEWAAEVGCRFPGLSKPQAFVLALYSFGMILAKSCGRTAVAAILAPLLGMKERSVVQRLREWCCETNAKKGDQRQELEVAACFPWLLKWILSLWVGNQMALALDATTLGAQFIVLAISIVYRGCAIPVAWTILKAGQQHAWNQEWVRMLKSLKVELPPSMTVIVLTDRGLYSRKLFKAIRRMKWHPFMRINAQGTFRPKGNRTFTPLKSLIPNVGDRWKGEGMVFKTNPFRCTLLACWAEGCTDPWFILTDLPPACADACWYALRAWIEHGFKITKRGGWQWHRTRMTDPNRAERLWLAIAVATLWLLCVGGEAEENLPESTFLDLTEALRTQRKRRKATSLRTVSLFRRGLYAILVALLRQDTLPFGTLRPDPWPEILQQRESLPPPGKLGQSTAA